MTTTFAPQKTRPALDGGRFDLVHTKTFNSKAGKGRVRTTYPSMTFYDGFGDTSKVGIYRPDSVLSVHDGMLDYDIHYDPTAKEYQVGQFGIDHDAPQLFGRWEVRFRADLIELYKAAFELWPSNSPGFPGGDWKRGEIDFAEFDLGKQISAFSHNVQGNPSQNAASYTFQQLSKDWHTVAVEWSPSYLQVSVDDTTVVTRNPAAIPVFPMRASFQVETNLDGIKPPVDARGHVLVDYVAKFKYTPPKLAVK